MASRPAIGHVHLKVRDLERAVDFYTDLLGLEVTERAGAITFLSWGEHHHDVALQERGPDAAPPGSGVGLYHVAFEVDDREALRSVYRNLRADGVDVSAVDHGISKALYFDDPDGNGLEVYVDTRSGDDEEWRHVSKPFDLEATTSS